MKIISLLPGGTKNAYYIPLTSGQKNTTLWPSERHQKNEFSTRKYEKSIFPSLDPLDKGPKNVTSRDIFQNANSFIVFTGDQTVENAHKSAFKNESRPAEA